MSLVLENSPNSPAFKTFGSSTMFNLADKVAIDGGSIETAEFLAIVAREILDGKLNGDDSLLGLVKAAKEAKLVSGYSLGFEAGEPPQRIDINFSTFEQQDQRGNLVDIVENIQLSRFDLAIAALYVLTNTNLREGDPRLQFLQFVKDLKIEPASGGETVRLELDKEADLSLLEVPAPISLGAHPLSGLGF